jgi:hypothetical protein
VLGQKSGFSALGQGKKPVMLKQRSGLNLEAHFFNRTPIGSGDRLLKRPQLF